jgi:antitoxin ParD1/3/4
MPNETADAVKSSVRIGDYTSESEVIREGLRALMARERAVESRLHQQVGPAYDAIQANPSRGLSADQVRAHLATRINKPARPIP